MQPSVETYVGLPVLAATPRRSDRPMCSIIGPMSKVGILTGGLRSKQTRDLELRLQVWRDDDRPFPLGWDKTIGSMDSRVKK